MLGFCVCGNVQLKLSNGHAANLAFMPSTFPNMQSAVYLTQKPSMNFWAHCSLAATCVIEKLENFKCAICGKVFTRGPLISGSVSGVSDHHISLYNCWMLQISSANVTTWFIRSWWRWTWPLGRLDQHQNQNKCTKCDTSTQMKWETYQSTFGHECAAI